MHVDIANTLSELEIYEANINLYIGKGKIMITTKRCRAINIKVGNTEHNIVRAVLSGIFIS